MKVLITGAAGLLGSHFAAALAGDHRVTGTDRHAWWGDRPVEFIQDDLLTPGFIEALLAQVSPDVLIHCAGLVNVDRCEEEPALAYAMNAELTARLARALSQKALFVYITTDGIFRGDAPMATEETLPCPRTVYGRSKLHGEWDVEILRHTSLIIRSNFFGWSSGRKQSSAEWLHAALERGAPVTLFDDLFFTPIYVTHLVERVVALVTGGHRGTFHVAGRDRVSKHQFGLALADRAGLSAAAIVRGSLDAASLAAPRPKDISLNSDKVRLAIGRDAPSIEDGITEFLADRGRPLSDRAGRATVRTSGHDD